MAKEEQAADAGISRVIRDEWLSSSEADLTQLNKTLVKSPGWKTNSFRQIESDRYLGPDDGVDYGVLPEPTMQRGGSRRMRQALDQHVEEAKAARRQLREQSTTLQQLQGEVDQLRQAVARLEAEKAGLVARHARELEERRVELQDFQAAYDQFEQQSDVLLDELHQKYARLQYEIRHQNPRSLL